MRRDRIIRGYLRHRLLVTTHEDLTWEGVVMDIDTHTVSLWKAVAISADGKRVPADGEVLLPRTDVAYMQVLAEMQTGQ